jgi:hypothetical protein
MIGVGLALMAMSDTQQSQAGTERVKDSAFQVGEAALNSQLFQLARSYPLVASKAYPAACTPASAAATPCPDAANLASSYTTADYTAQCNNTAVVPWTTTVKDNNNGAESYYSSAVVQNNPSFDANGDGAMWVRAVGRPAAGRVRSSSSCERPRCRSRFRATS